MAVFAFDNGRLVQRAASHVAPDIADGVLNAVREQVLDLIEQPLFSVGWVRADSRDDFQDSLLCLDGQGHIVTVEVLPALDPQSLLAALARTGRHGDFSRAQLADLYPGGQSAFSADWTTFLETTSASVQRGPRLFLFVSVVSDDVLAPLAALNGAGVSAKRITIHRGHDGLLVDVGHIAPTLAFLPPASRAVSLEGSVSPRVMNDDDRNASPSAGDSHTEQTDAVQTNTMQAKFARATRASSPRAAQRKDDAQSDKAQPQAQTAAPSPQAQIEEQALSQHVASRFLRRRKRKVKDDELSQAPKITQIPDGSVRHDPLEDPTLHAPANLKTTYDLMIEASKRPEQRLWDMSAPRSGSAQTFVSERASASASSLAVQRAAEHTLPTLTSYHKQPGQASRSNTRPDPRLVKIAQQRGMITLRWKSLRRNVDLAILLTAEGLLKTADGRIFTDPSQAAQVLSGHRVDGWRVWRAGYTALEDL